MIEAGFQGRGLAEVAAQADNHDAFVGAGDFRELAEGAILAAIVDEHDLIRLAERVHGVDDLDVELRDALLLVIERHDHGIGYRAAFGQHRPPLYYIISWASHRDSHRVRR